MLPRRTCVAGLVMLATLIGCQPKPAAPVAETKAPPPGPAPGTPEYKIQSAMAAAPASISNGATIMELPMKATDPPTTLKPGTNGWTCLANSPQAMAQQGNDPMCLDKSFMEWAQAWLGHKTPNIKSTGIGYMMKGDVGASLTNPYDTIASPTNKWVKSGPHIMVVVPTAALAGISDDPSSGGPYVMWKGTPYAHIMVPLQ